MLTQIGAQIPNSSNNPKCSDAQNHNNKLKKSKYITQVGRLVGGLMQISNTLIEFQPQDKINLRTY